MPPSVNTFSGLMATKINGYQDHGHLPGCETKCYDCRSSGMLKISSVFQRADQQRANGHLLRSHSLVFFGDDAGYFAAVDASTGHPLWEFNTGQSLRASLMTYEVDGVQYVAIATGSDVFSFSLPQ
jgi:outer membrane protein assembly factor BamB